MIALAAAAGGLIVTGDVHLLSLAEQVPVVSPSEFVDRFLETAS